MLRVTAFEVDIGGVVVAAGETFVHHQLRSAGPLGSPGPIIGPPVTGSA
jgi:hypothetical protein